MGYEFGIDIIDKVDVFGIEGGEDMGEDLYCDEEAFAMGGIAAIFEGFAGEFDSMLKGAALCIIDEHQRRLLECLGSYPSIFAPLALGWIASPPTPAPRPSVAPEVGFMGFGVTEVMEPSGEACGMDPGDIPVDMAVGMAPATFGVRAAEPLAGRGGGAGEAARDMAIGIGLASLPMLTGFCAVRGMRI